MAANTSPLRGAANPYGGYRPPHQKELTNLEMEAMNLVNEEYPGPRVTDEEKYEELLNSRKERKAVSMKQFDFSDNFTIF